MAAAALAKLAALADVKLSSRGLNCVPAAAVVDALSSAAVTATVAKSGGGPIGQAFGVAVVASAFEKISRFAA